VSYPGGNSIHRVEKREEASPFSAYFSGRDRGGKVRYEALSKLLQNL
jgi:hypothetical protein